MQISSENQIVTETLELSRDVLLMPLKFMSAAIMQLALAESDECADVETDGKAIYYSPEFVKKIFSKEHTRLSHILLHSTLHSVLYHLFSTGMKEREIWDLSCDISVESVISSLSLRQVKTAGDADREKILDKIRKKVAVMTAEKLYIYFSDNRKIYDEISENAYLFRMDTHDVWYSSDMLKDEGVSVFWKNEGDKILVDLQTISADLSERALYLIKQLEYQRTKSVDLNVFLEKFTLLCEDRRCSADEFDYILYTYGMEHYGNMPLIEPIEQRESKKIGEFIIAIDTSGSCDGDLVNMFFERVRLILEKSVLFTRDIILHIVECDDEIRNVTKIKGTDELKKIQYIKELHGFGATDYRPVFKYAEDMLKKGEFTRLNGILYFTDGEGTFPKHMPKQKSAFIIVRENREEEVEVPPWAYYTVIEKKDLMVSD